MKEVDTALFTEAFSSIKPEGDRLKSKMAPLFWEELIDFHAPKQPHRALEELKKKPAFEARDKALLKVPRPLASAPSPYRPLSRHGGHGGVPILPC